MTPVNEIRNVHTRRIYRLRAEAKWLKPKERIARLTKREMQVAKLLAKSKINKEIADKLVITKKTVDYYRREIFAKLGVNSVISMFKLLARERVVKL